MVVMDRRNIYGGGYVVMSLRDYEKIVDEAEMNLYGEPDDDDFFNEDYCEDGDEDGDEYGDEHWRDDWDDENFDYYQEDYKGRQDYFTGDSDLEPSVFLEDSVFSAEKDRSDYNIPEASTPEDDDTYFEENLPNIKEDFNYQEERPQDVDINNKYGKMEQKSTRGKWSIPKEVKQVVEGEGEIPSEEENRYYFESL